MRNCKGLVLTLLVGTALLTPGCVGRAIGEGAEKATGPKGAYWEVKPCGSTKDHRALASYKNFELGPVRNEAGKNVPPDFLQKFPTEFAKRLKDSGLPTDHSGKTVVFDVTIVHYETADKTDNVFGPLEQVVAKVQLVDKETHQPLAEGVAIGRTGKSVGLGTEWKAWGLSKGLLKWAKDYYPKGKDDKEDA
jgi:hypothetical protein